MANATLPDTDIAAKLEAAGDLIAKPGVWAQGILYVSGDCACAVGALMKVSGEKAGEVERGPLYPALKAGIHAVSDDHDWFSVDEWNDRPDRTVTEVVAAFRKAAELARSAALSEQEGK